MVISIAKEALSTPATDQETDVQPLLCNLTGWNLSFFALKVDIVQERGVLRPNDHYGKMNLFLWKSLEGVLGYRDFEAKMTFRQLKDGDTIWRSGTSKSTVPRVK